MVLFSNYRIVTCPDGSVRYVYKDPDKVFPLEASKWKAQVELAANMLEEISAHVGVGITNDISGFYTLIDQANGSMQLAFRGLYHVYSTNPCEKHEWLSIETQKLIENENRLRRLNTMLATLRTMVASGATSEQINDYLRLASYDLDKSETVIEASKELHKARTNVAKWAEE